MKKQGAHEFAFYTDTVAELVEKELPTLFTVNDKELAHRMAHVVRLQQGDQIILFDRMHQAQGEIIYTGKEKSGIRINTMSAHMLLQPSIEWALPLLKREAFEEALYSLTELGVSSIQPIMTHKTVRFFDSGKEPVRWQKILQAAAEQSKHFALPLLKPPCTLEHWLERIRGKEILFLDASGIPLWQVLTDLRQKKVAELYVCSGPEGDLIDEEKELLKAQNVTFCALTKTVLRAQQAVAVALGAFRSLL